MSGSVTKVDITIPSVPARRVALCARRDAVVAKPGGTREIYPGPGEAAVCRTTEFLVSGDPISLPRFERAIDLYRKNADERRTLFSGPFFVDTYA